MDLDLADFQELFDAAPVGLAVLDENLRKEFRHRVKNLLAVVGSLIGHARRTAQTPADLAETIQRQLQALGAAQDVLLNEEAESVPLEAVVVAALKPFNVSSLHIEGGPDIAIAASAVLPFTLALHELATNAMKHGALSHSGGRATILWSVEAGRASIVWTEAGGPEVSAPGRKGFGSTLFEMLKRRLDGGSVKLDFLPAGLSASIEFDLPS